MSVAEQQTAPRGLMAEVAEGRRLRYVLTGPDSSHRPLVVLEAGSFGFSADWAAVQEKLSRRGLRSLAYDRAGLGFSRPGPEPRDGRAIVQDLERLLSHLGEPGPFVLCGHSMAGLHVRLFAARNANRVVGVVLVDATTPEAMDSKMISGFVQHFGRASRLAAWGAEAGLLAPLSGTGLGDAIGLEGAPGMEKRWAFAHPLHNHWAAQEVQSWADSAREAREAGHFDPRLPVAVILTGTAADRTGFRALQIAPAKASNHGRVDYVAGASHATMLNGVFADAIIRGVEHAMGLTADDAEGDASRVAS
jgi:pimeloyl-ACP methyl ester carboxylesterase